MAPERRQKSWSFRIDFSNLSLPSTVIPETVHSAYKTFDVHQMDQVGLSRPTKLEDESQDQAIVNSSRYFLQRQLTIATISRPQYSQIMIMTQHKMDVDLTSTLCAMDAMDMDPNLSENIYEPLRALTTSDPPKRFHRTVWRSLTRRLMQMKLMRN